MHPANRRNGARGAQPQRKMSYASAVAGGNAMQGASNTSPSTATAQQTYGILKMLLGKGYIDAARATLDYVTS